MRVTVGVFRVREGTKEDGRRRVKSGTWRVGKLVGKSGTNNCVEEAENLNLSGGF